MKSDESEGSKSDEEKEEEVNEEEEEQDEEKEENQEEEVEENSEHINIKELENPNSFIISLQLIKKFDNMSQDDSETIIIDFLKNVGLPMHFNNEETLALYLYFHKICVTFYKL